MKDSYREPAVTVADLLAQEVRTGEYEVWSEEELCAEIAHRQLSHGINERSFPEPVRRCARLAETLRGNDRLREFLRSPAVEIARA